MTPHPRPGRSALVQALGDAERRRRALDRADQLITHAQTDADWIDQALTAALAEAVDWPEVRVMLLHATAARAQFTGAAPSDILAISDELYRMAERHGLSAMQAVALCYRVEADHGRSGAVPFDTLADIRLLLDDTRQPVRDRLAGLVVLASLYAECRLESQEAETLVEIERLAAQIGDPTRTLTVTTANRALSAAFTVLDAVEAGMLDEAERARRRLEAVAGAASWQRLPAPWRRRLEAYRRLAAALIDDETLTPDDFDRATSGLAEDRDVVRLLRLLTPVATWPGHLDLDAIEPERESAARFLYARALGLDCRPTRASEAHRRHARLLAARAWHVRRAAGSALAERIAARRLDAERGALESQILTDPLTGARNRRALRAVLERSAGQRVTLLTLDLDAFKLVNDRWGHQVGDAVLQRTAEAIAAALGVQLHGPYDEADEGPLLARVGGDEFVALVRSDDELAGRRLAAELAAGVSRVDWSGLLDGEVQRVTVGVAVGRLGADLLTSSDLDMLERKQRHEARVPG